MTNQRYIPLLIVLLLSLTACGSSEEAPAAPPLQAATSSHIPRLLQQDALFEQDGAQFKIKLSNASDLVLPSGQIIAADPISFPETPPLFHRVEPGGYPVTVSFAQQPGAETGSLVAMTVCFTENPPATWHFVAEGVNAGYTVESGTSAFASPESMVSFEDQAFRVFGIINTGYLDQFGGIIERQGWVNWGVETGTENNLILVDSGDGYNRLYWALDAEGNIACLLSDFSGFEDAAPQ